MMASTRADVVVLGAGIAGVSVAIHLVERGRSVVLVDRRGPGEETSFGNAGLIQREGIVPYAFPQDIRTVLRHARNRSIDASYHPSALPFIAGRLAQYWWHSRGANHLRIQRLYEPLIARSLDEHATLIDKSGAETLIGKTGWLKAFRSARAFDIAAAEADRLKTEFGLGHERLSSAQFAAEEPDVLAPMAGAIRWTSSWSIRDPHALIQAYVRYFQSRGGQLVRGDAAGLGEHATERVWCLDLEHGRVQARDVVVALGPWSDVVTRPLGYRLPIMIKRGYHMHYRARDGKTLNNPLFDAEAGYMVSPMRAGIRLTTGAEFALRDAPQSPVQLERAERVALAVAPLGERIDRQPWMGARPCTPDMMPIIGPAPRHRGLWFALGHGHHGMTLGPITGRLLAEQMTDGAPSLDPEPYRPNRFRI